jgi:hypothetical protein
MLDMLDVLDMFDSELGEQFSICSTASMASKKDLL